ncbi:MAG: MCE family protein [Myxococcales bacterium]|nr:MCE family protein [Myxococcales bacterium]
MFTKRDYKVGAFVVLGLGLIVLVVFLIGNDRRAFQSHREYKILFDDVMGLRPGAPVHLGGVRIGAVSSVEYTKEDYEKVHVAISVVASDANRIRTDSVAQVAAKGMLGDKMLIITRGSADELPDGSIITSKASSDLFGTLAALGDDVKSTLGDAKTAIGKIQELAEKLADDGLQDNLKGTLAEVRALLHEVTTGSGYPARFLSDATEADRISRLVDTIDQTARELGATVRSVRYAVERVQAGPGFAHDLLYGEGPKKQVEQIGSAAEEVALALRGVRQADSFAHDVLFGGKRGDDALQNVTALTADLRDIVRDIKSGKGTIGALLVDPSIYEDVKRVLGNVERNNVLRALVRYSLKKDDTPPKVDVGER